MRKVLTIILFTLFAMSSCHELTNILDPESDDYIGFPSIDLDGDGIGQYDDVDEIELISPDDRAVLNKFPITLSTNLFNPEKVTKYRIQVSSNMYFDLQSIVYDNS